jgi:dynein assembly factor 1, axonemal
MPFFDSSTNATSSEAPSDTVSAVDTAELHSHDSNASEISEPVTPLNVPRGSRPLTSLQLTRILQDSKKQYYSTKSLNDKLFVHYGGWTSMDLHEFTGLKCLYAECNAFDSIDGLTECNLLRSLYLNQNAIRKIENLETLIDLWSLNLADNFIEKIENLQFNSNLNTLNLSNNLIGNNGIEDFQKLSEYPWISCLELTNNKIADIEIIEVLKKMTNLTVLYLKGNPVCKEIPYYRKRMINELNNLKFLDDRPIFEDERRCAEAFMNGGVQSEKEERQKIQTEKENEYRKNQSDFEAMLAEAKLQHQSMQAAPIVGEMPWIEELEDVLSALESVTGG